MCGPQIRLYLFTFRSIALNQLHSLTPIDAFSSVVQRYRMRLVVRDAGFDPFYALLSTQNPGIVKMYLFYINL